jgi:hypothetical protein
LQVLTETSWSPRRELTLAEWIGHGKCLGSVARASGWWIGDWIRYGNAKYGEKYEAAAKVTGYDIQSLMNMAYVARRFEISRRREKLSFSHHAELAALPPDQQDLWLDRTEREALSVHVLRVALKRAAALRPASQSLEGADARARATQRSGGDSEVVCPECGHQFRAKEQRDVRKAAVRRR